MKELAPPPRAAWLTIVVIGCLAIVMGLTFVTLRPLVVLLPEDQRYTGLSPEGLRCLNPQLFAWVGMVFRSWGAFAIGLGVAIAGIGAFGYRRGQEGSGRLLALAGLPTLLIFLAVNVTLGSDFIPIIGLVLAAYLGALLYGWLARRGTAKS